MKGEIWLFLDETLISTGSSAKELDLSEGECYLLHWVIKGTPGSAYSISVSSPREAQYLLTSVIGDGGKEFGGFKFST
ncbi:hypothetical protein [Algoriphagus terrigena]|uniref:hypothetical protein n=1 Tax=Algoriphagus terrigena TaxID=344884 RepID=UPI00040BE68F|nr:hypothetical protein [Algoriphagus terrigena]